MDARDAAALVTPGAVQRAVVTSAAFTSAVTDAAGVIQLSSFGG